MAFGRKTGGRKPGTPNRATAALAAAVAEAGITPLQYLLSVMRDETQPAELRLDAAKAAAPYCHAKLSAIAVRAEIDDRRDAETRRVLMDKLVGFIEQRPAHEIEGECVIREVPLQHRIA